jgi:hypothetical protein
MLVKAVSTKPDFRNARLSIFISFDNFRNKIRFLRLLGFKIEENVWSITLDCRWNSYCLKQACARQAHQTCTNKESVMSAKIIKVPSQKEIKKLETKTKKVSSNEQDKDNDRKIEEIKREEEIANEMFPTNYFMLIA